MFILNEIIPGIEKNLVKGQGTEIKNGRSRVSAPLNAPVRSLGIMIIERIDTTGIVIGTGTGIEKGKETAVVNVTEVVIVIEGGTAAVIMSAIEIKNVIGSVTVIVLEIGTGIMRLGTLTTTVAIPVMVRLNMLALIQSMRGTVTAKRIEIMTTWHQKMTRDGTNNQNMGIGTQIMIMTVIIMSITVVSTTIWMSRMNVTAMSIILIMIVTIMIVWRMTTTMSVEMWTATIDDLRGPFLGSTEY